MSKAYPANLPTTYERNYLARMRSDWSGAMGSRLREWVPRIFPGVPVEAHMGFTSNGSANGDPGLTPAHTPFHEVGYYGVEAGPYNTPAPNADTSQPNSWYRLHADPRVVGLLGRQATMTPWPVYNYGTSSASADIPLDDQLAVGIVNIADDARRMAAAVPASVAPRDPSSLWATALGFMGWSAGVGGASAHVRRYADQIANAPEDRRWIAFLRAIASDPNAAPGASHSHAAYSANRTQQKLRVGRALAQAVGGNVEWFQIDDAAEDVLARRAASNSVPVGILPYRQPAGVSGSGTGTTRGVSAGALTFLAVALVAAGVIAWRKRR